MNNVFNREKEPWIRPWQMEKFDDLYNRDERFFSIIIKGLISWLNRNIVLYNKPINHFIFNTGSSYLYMESNGYEYNLNETTGEDMMYMQLPRCVMNIGDIAFPSEELTSPYARGNYERRTGNMLSGYNAEIRRLPIEISIDLRYYLSNFNETIVLLQELIDKIVFQQYYNVIYLGQVIQCSIEFPANVTPEINKIDMTSPEPNQRNIALGIKICTNYPLINTRTETPTDKIITSYGYQIDIELNNQDADIINKGEPINNDLDGYNEFVDNLNGDKPVTNPEIIDTLNEYHEKDSELQDIINEYDTNGDGVIDENDITESTTVSNEETIHDLINTYDTNGDGVIDENDIVTTENEDGTIESNENIINDLINEYDTNGDNVIDENDIVTTEIDSNEKTIKELLELYDTNGDGVIDGNDLLSEFDVNGDGIVDAEDLEIILDKIKYENNDPDPDLNGVNTDPVEDCHYRIDYKDLYVIIKLINSHGNISVDYDRLTNKIYTTNNETGEVKEIDMIKYKINK